MASNVEFFFIPVKTAAETCEILEKCLCKLGYISYLCLRMFDSEEDVRNLTMIIGIGVHQVIEIGNQLQNFVNWWSETVE